MKKPASESQVENEGGEVERFGLTGMGGADRRTVDARRCCRGHPTPLVKDLGAGGVAGGR